MQYYIIKSAVNRPDTGGIYPQVQKMEKGYDYDASNSVHALSKAVKEFPTFTPNLNSFVLHNAARISDLLSVSVIHGGLLVSSKLKGLLENFNLPVHKFYTANVIHRKKSLAYFWMHIISDLTNSVDYTKSIFKVYENYKNTLGYVKVSSKEHLISEKQKIKELNPGKSVTIWADKICLNDSFDGDLDLFEIGMYDDNCYISDRLREHLVLNKVTGIEITKADNLLMQKA